jgi:hypothetical protein
MGRTILISPEPLAIACVSHASFGLAHFNSPEDEDTALLNEKLQEDSLCVECEPCCCLDPAYNTNYVMTMGHVARNYPRHRRLRIYSVGIGCGGHQDHCYGQS